MTQMTRRSFTAGSVAAAMATMLPSWLHFKQRKQIDLTPFCGDDSWLGRRYALDQPFAQEGLVYATDARICVRTALADIPALGETAKLPGASALPWWNREHGVWKPWPKRVYFGDGHDGICPHCDGKGGFGNVQDCSLCEGLGFISPDGYTAPDCKACNGTGKRCSVCCDYCDGTGWTDRPHMLRIGDTAIGGQYDGKLRRLSDLEYAEFAGLPDRKLWDYNPIAVRGDGFEALVMPIVRSERRAT